MDCMDCGTATQQSNCPLSLSPQLLAWRPRIMRVSPCSASYAAGAADAGLRCSVRPP